MVYADFRSITNISVRLFRRFQSPEKMFLPLLVICLLAVFSGCAGKILYTFSILICSIQVH